jgi:hypothetical protein
MRRILPRISRFARRSLSIALLTLGLAPAGNAQTPPSADEVRAIAQDAYIYLYPLVTMDVTRRQFTNVEPGKVLGRGPMNTFANIPTFPPADFRSVVRPNFDTLYSSGWLDITKEPVIVSAPDTQGRYYLLPMLDMWSDVFAVPGKRTTGTAAASWAIVPQGWSGNLPKGVEPIESPTPYVWVLGRTQTNGVKDYDAVHKIQAGYTIVPLSQRGKPVRPQPVKIDPSVDMKTPPLRQVNGMAAADFFRLGADLMAMHAPHVTDWSIVARMRRIGLTPGEKFDASKLDAATRAALDAGAADALTLMKAKETSIAPVVNGWQVPIDTIGVYGDTYLKRAIIAMVGLGANQPEDAVYPGNVGDADGKPLRGENNYVLHFDKANLPPVEAFWSLTMYDAEGFQVANPINRFAIGDRDDLKFSAAGSLDLYIQNKSPGADKESNWLPSPASGLTPITMRLYAPKPEVLDGRWKPPAVKKVE